MGHPVLHYTFGTVRKTRRHIIDSLLWLHVADHTCSTWAWDSRTDRVIILIQHRIHTDTLPRQLLVCCDKTGGDRWRSIAVRFDGMEKREEERRIFGGTFRRASQSATVRYGFLGGAFLNGFTPSCSSRLVCTSRARAGPRFGYTSQRWCEASKHVRIKHAVGQTYRTWSTLSSTTTTAMRQRPPLL